MPGVFPVITVVIDQEIVPFATRTAIAFSLNNPGLRVVILPWLLSVKLSHVGTARVILMIGMRGRRWRKHVCLHARGEDGKNEMTRYKENQEKNEISLYMYSVK